MGKIGNFGKTITFAVGAEKILTFGEMDRTVSGRWKKHNIHGKKPRSEFTGPDSQNVEMTVVLSAEHKVRPRKMLEKIEKAIETGKTEYLVIGGKKVGSGKMYIESASEAWDCVYNNGELVRATVKLTFSEY